jgi:hypothetical protein
MEGNIGSLAQKTVDLVVMTWSFYPRTGLRTGRTPAGFPAVGWRCYANNRDAAHGVLAFEAYVKRHRGAEMRQLFRQGHEPGAVAVRSELRD